MEVVLNEAVGKGDASRSKRKCILRSNKALSVTGPISRKATFKKSGVFMANATFKSNSNFHFMV